MEMNLRNLQAFLTVSELLNFTRAADLLGYAQSSVTGQIRALEEAVGQPLFERVGKRVVLTGAGRRFQPYAARMVALAQEAMEVVQEAEACSGTLRIGAAETLCIFRLPGIIRRYRMRYPKVQAQLETGACARLWDALRHGHLDVALMLDQPSEDPDFVLQTLMYEPISVVTYPWHPLASAASVGPEGLAGEPLIHTEAESTYRIEFDKHLAAAGVTPGTVTEFNSIEAIKQCVMAGLGISVLPSVACAQECERGALVELKWAGPPMQVAAMLGYRRSKRVTPALAAFLEAVQQQMGSLTAMRI